MTPIFRTNEAPKTEKKENRPDPKEQMELVLKLKEESQRPETSYERLLEIKEIFERIKKEINESKKGFPNINDSLWDIITYLGFGDNWKSKDVFLNNSHFFEDLRAVALPRDQFKPNTNRTDTGQSFEFYDVTHRYKDFTNNFDDRVELYEKSKPIVICSKDDKKYEKWLRDRGISRGIGEETSYLKISYVFDYAREHNMYVPGLDYFNWLKSTPVKDWPSTIKNRKDNVFLFGSALRNLKDANDSLVYKFSPYLNMISSHKIYKDKSFDGVLLLPTKNLKQKN